MVTVSGTRRRPVVASRRRIELIGARLPRQPYHAIAEEGAPRTVVAQVERAALKAARSAVTSAVGVRVVGVVAAERQLPSDIDAILRSHARLHAAEGRLYERCVIDAAGELGLPVLSLDPAFLDVCEAVEGLGRVLGPPWQKDHKLATEAALAALSLA